LEPVFDDPRFACCDFDLDPSLIGNEYLYEDFDGRNPGKLNWEPVPLASLWKPCRLLGKVQPYHDYPAPGSQTAIFSRRAVETLKDLLPPSGELLPTITQTGEYYVYNILHKSDAFDVAKSIAEFMPSSGKETAISIERYELRPERIGNHAIFRLREDPASIMVTDRFKERVENAALNGFFFAKIWPLAADEKWEDLETRQRKADRQAVRTLKGQCITILLSTVKGEATKEEENRGLKLVEALSDLLVSQATSLNMDCLGAIDYLEPFRGKLGIHICCPDVDRVMPVIQPWLQSLDWPSAVVLDKFYGSRFEKKTRKVREKIKS
jgi:hypothetical protein